MKEEDMIKKFWGFGIVFVIVLILFGCFFIVPGGHYAIVFNKISGTKDKIYDEGIHGKWPILDKAYKYETRILKEEATASAASNDLQTVTSTIALNFRLDETKLVEIFQTEGRKIEEVKARLIDPSIQESVKAITAKYTAEELITKREMVKEAIKEYMINRLIQYHIIVTDFSMTDFQFSDEFNAAIESKQTAEQLAQKAQRDLERVKLEAQQKIEQAKAEAESLRLQKEQITPDLIKLRFIETWDGVLPVVFGGAGANLLDITGMVVPNAEES